MGFRLPVLQCLTDEFFSSRIGAAGLSENIGKTLSRENIDTACFYGSIGAAYYAEQVREMDLRAIEEGSDNALPIPGIQLMKRAGRGLLQLILAHWPKTDRIYVFCGTGNNGGDGYIVAAIASQKGIDVHLVEVDPAKVKGDALLARQYAVDQGVEPITAKDWLLQAESEELSGGKARPSNQPRFQKSGVIVDALLGIGFSGALRAPYKDLVKEINESSLSVISADIASGLSADTGSIFETAVKADVTLSFIAMKVGLLTGVGREYSGDIYLDKLGIADPSSWILEDEDIEVLDIANLLSLLPHKHVSSHKGSNGHLVVVGGDENYGGAVLMAAEAALRLGAGLVSVITRAEHRNAILARRPELMVVDASQTDLVTQLLEKASSIVVGPGLGKNAWGQKLLQLVFASSAPKVVDADALNILAKSTNSITQNSFKNSVFTPHPGEASRLLDEEIAHIQSDRISSTLRLQKRFGATVLLKGSGTVIASSVGEQVPFVKVDRTRLSICPYGNPGMASGGMGDVLSGVIGSLLAQGMPVGDATKLGCALHSKAADIAGQKRGIRGLLATDLIAYLSQLVNDCLD